MILYYTSLLVYKPELTPRQDHPIPLFIYRQAIYSNLKNLVLWPGQVQCRLVKGNFRTKKTCIPNSPLRYGDVETFQSYLFNFKPPFERSRGSQGRKKPFWTLPSGVSRSSLTSRGMVCLNPTGIQGTFAQPFKV